MYCVHDDQEALEDDLYREDNGDSDGSEVTSELEFHLYSQLHYSSNVGEMEEHQDSDRQLQEADRTRDVEGERRDRCRSPQKQSKKKKEKRAKELKEKEKSKTPPRSTFYRIEEVIVIDSSPDVISISEGEDGICASKGQSLKKQKTQKERRRSGPVVVSSSSSDSDSESSESDSDSSGSSDASKSPDTPVPSGSPVSSEASESEESYDSDRVETWMLLGQQDQDGDQSISLNLEGESRMSDSDGEQVGGTWLVSEKDKEAQIFNKRKGDRASLPRVANRYYTFKSIQCRNCNKSGHLSKNCTEARKVLSCLLCGTPGHMVAQCPNRHCNNCGLPGHMYHSCDERPYWNKTCTRCNMVGHFSDSCPEIWRQYHITTQAGTLVQQQKEDRGRNPAYCYNCSKKGHFGHACTRQRMFNGTYPSTPFINYYDTKTAIQERQHRTKLRVRDLKQKGLFAPDPQIFLSPEPPKKKQKIVHHKKSHQAHQSPQHSTPKSHPSHIFFNESTGSPTPKRKKPGALKEPERIGSVKTWTPKRPVPATRPTPTLFLDESQDFPRGRKKHPAQQKETQAVPQKKKNKWKKKKSAVPVSAHQCQPTKGKNQKSWEKFQKERQKIVNQQRKHAAKKGNAHMYPRDENLFNIKQRKRQR